MRQPNEWTSHILSDLRGDQSSVEQHEILNAYVRLIQDDAKTPEPSNTELLLEYHEQQKEWWRTNTNDPHGIGTALYTMHCDMVNIYGAILSGDAKRNYDHNKKSLL